ncbi:MAG: OmpL47-type beta-barrel domain-containing protein, partial [Candidatus Hodarchaeales archaeon]
MNTNNQNIKLVTVKADIIDLGSHDDGLSAVEFSPDGKILASVAADTNIKLWNVSDFTLIDTITGHTNGVLDIRFSTDGSLAATCDSGGIVKIWSTLDWSVLHSWHAHSGYCWSVFFNGDASLLVTAGDDNLVKTWYVSNASLHKTFSGHTNRVTNAIFAPDGKTIASAGWDDTVILWNLTDKSKINILTGHTQNVGSITFNNNGSLLASGSWDHTIKIWNPDTGSLINTFTGHTGSVSGLAFTPDTKKLVSGGTDESVRIWYVSNTTLINTFVEHSADVNDIDINPFQDLIASGGNDNKVILYRGYLGYIQDNTPPETSFAISGDPGENDWSIHDLQVSLSATDDLSGVANTYYSLDNKTWYVYSDPITLSEDKFNLLYYYSVDNANNIESIKSAPLALQITDTTVDDRLIRLKMVNTTPFIVFERWEIPDDSSSRNPWVITWYEGAWQETQLSTLGWGYHFDIAVSPEGIPHIVFVVGKGGSTEESFPYHTYWNGNGWTPPIIIPGPWGSPPNNKHANPQYPRIAFESNGILDVVIEVDDNMKSGDFGSDTDGLIDIYYFTRSTTGIWTNHGVISTGSGINNNRPAIDIDNNDGVHVLYGTSDNNNGRIFYRYKPYGSSWQSVESPVANKRLIHTFKRIVVDDSNVPHILYADYSQTQPYNPSYYYQFRNNSIWSLPDQLGNGYGYDLDINKNGVLQILSYNSDLGNLTAHTKLVTGDGWTVKRLTSINDGMFLFPQCEYVDNSSAWAFTKLDNTSMSYDIYYIPPKIITSTPNPPQNLQASAGNGYVDLTWNPPANDGGTPITSYSIYRKTTGSYTFLASTTNLAYNDTSVANGITYYYVVTAWNSVGESSSSNEVYATPDIQFTVPQPP